MKRLGLAVLLAVAVHGWLFWAVGGEWLRSGIRRGPLKKEITISLEVRPEARKTAEARAPAPAARKREAAPSAAPEKEIDTALEPPDTERLVSAPESEPEPPVIRKHRSRKIVKPPEVPELPPRQRVMPTPEAESLSTVHADAEIFRVAEGSGAPAAGREQESDITAAGPKAGAGAPNAPAGAVAEAVSLYEINPPPDYPHRARRRGYQGTVLLHVLVDEEGRAETIELKASSGHGILDRAAVEAVRRWRFQPGSRGGAPVVMWVDVPVEFRLR